MPETRLSLIAAVALALTAAAPGFAQDAPPAADGTEAPAPSGGSDFSTGEEVGAQVGQDYVMDTKGDWEIRCVKTEDGFDPCSIYQLLKDEHDNSVAEFSLVALPGGSEAAAGATVITPLETLLTEQVTLAVDGGKAKRYPFSWCSPIGCFARIGFTGDELAGMKKGNKATITIVPMLARDQKVELAVSLTGFTAAFDAMKTANEETQKRADEAKKAAGGGGN